MYLLVTYLQIAFQCFQRRKTAIISAFPVNWSYQIEQTRQEILGIFSNGGLLLLSRYNHKRLLSRYSLTNVILLNNHGSVCLLQAWLLRWLSFSTLSYRCVNICDALSPWLCEMPLQHICHSITLISIFLTITRITMTMIMTERQWYRVNIIHRSDVRV